MEIFVKLKILLENDDAGQVEKLIHLKFDRIWRRGDVRQNTKIIEKSAGCSLNSGESVDASLDQHLNSLLLRLHDDISTIKNLSRSNTVEVSCAIYSDSVPAFYFDNSTIDRIAELGASLDIDFYLLPKISIE